MRFVFLLERIHVRIFNELVYYTDAVGGFRNTTTPIQGSEYFLLRISVGTVIQKTQTHNKTSPDSIQGYNVYNTKQLHYIKQYIIVIL